MKAMLLGFVAVGVIAFGANIALEEMGFGAADVTASKSNVRLGDADTE
ncbi:hypothetical protein [Thalassococcus profundi]|nr:hypothetical protein [Thalassococcus profundi]